MKPTIHSLGLDRLPLEDRLDLAEQLWQSVDEELKLEPLSDSQRAELDRRLADAEMHPEKDVPWETVAKQAHERWNGRQTGRLRLPAKRKKRGRCSISPAFRIPPSRTTSSLRTRHR
ncbi:MAG: addiction module protein [Gemmataceae bacterium]|nr:addiction module protein [Gemmataceae bacterium]